MKTKLFFLLCFFTILNTTAQIPDFSKVPGKVIKHSPKSTGKFIGSPTICILPNGDYVAGCDMFGNSSPNGYIFKSTDKGETWTEIAVINNSFWAGMFVHNGILYHMGPNRQCGDFVIRKSTDGGETWTNPVDANSGFLLPQEQIGEYGYHTSTTAVTVHNGRIWRALEMAPTSGAWGAFRAMIMSAPVDADLLKASSWTVSNALEFNKSWKANCVTWLEGNTVVAPDGKMKIMPRVDYRVDNKEKSVLIDVSDDGSTVSLNPNNFFDFPGGCKKFTVRYDEVSGKYWALTNYVPDEFLTAKTDPLIERGRNTQALCSSTDLKNWKVESIYLQHFDILYHGFQYVDWVFDGNDIIVASRTAHDDGIGGAENSHNANMLTFHRIRNFRTMTMNDRYIAPKVNGEDVSVAGFENFVSTAEISIFGRRNDQGNLMSVLTEETNPYKTGINQSEKVLKFVRNKGGFWGESIKLYFKGLYETRYYMHVMLYAESQLTDVSAIFKTTRKEDASTDLVMSYPPVNPGVGKWIDIVVPVPRNIKGVYGISIAPDRNLQATAQNTVYYIDNIMFSDDPAPRTTPVTHDDVLGEVYSPIVGIENPVKVNILTSDKNVKIMDFMNGKIAYGNRSYVLENIPDDVTGWKFIQLNGGVATPMTAQVLSNGYLYRTVSAAELDLYDMLGWERVNVFTPNYTDSGKSSLLIYRKAVTSGETITIEQHGWAGSAVISPQLTLNEKETSVSQLTTENITITFNGDNTICIKSQKNTNEKCRLSIYDLSGKIVFQQDFKLQPENYFHMNSLSKQTYLIKIESKDSIWQVSKSLIVS